MKNYSYFNGKIIALKNVKISPYDIGLLRGYGVFDVMCTQNGKPFLLDQHWQRLKNSARELNLKIPLAKNKYEKILAKLLKRNGFKKSTIRTILTGGFSNNGFSYQPGRETFLILIEKFQPLPPAIYQKGAKVVTQSFTRYCPQAKITNYVEAIRRQDEQEIHGALEIVYLAGRQVLEASTSNIFMVKNNKVITAQDNILIGMTRNLVIKLANKNKYQVEERNFSVKELLAADEVFLTATNKDIAPIVKIDHKKIGTGQVGKTTQLLMKAFNDFVKKY